MGGIPGHFSLTELIGTVKIIRKHAGGQISGVLLRVHVTETAPVDIVVVADRWPDGLREGAHLWVKGALAQECGISHRKNLHYIAADHLRICRPWTARYEAERGAR
jgi:hypothetical protein